MLKRETRPIVIVLLVVAVLLRQPVAIILLGLLGLTLAAAIFWSRYALRRVSYERTLSSTRAFVGDELVLTQRVANAKLLSLPNLQIDDSVPAAMDYGEQRLAAHSMPHLQTLRRWTALRPYEAAAWSVRFRCTRRGLYRFGPASVEATDAFGLQTRGQELPAQTRLIVYPELIALPSLALRAQHPVGLLRAPRQLLTDPARTVGVRDYRRDDPLKTIHWGATARRGELQTRVFEPTTSLDIAIVLDLDTFEYYWEGMRYDLVEQMISAAATIATEAAAERLGFGLYVNGSTAESGQLVRVPPSRAPAQLGRVLEELAALVPYSVVPLPTLLQRLGPTLAWGATIVLVSAVSSAAMHSAVLRVASRGRRVVWLYAGEGELPRLPAIEVHALTGTTTPWAGRPRPALTPTTVS